MTRFPSRRPSPADLPQRVWHQALKASLLVSLTLILLLSATLYLADGRRIQVGSLGFTVLKDVNGQPYLVVDRRKATSVMVDLSLAQGGLQVYTGQVHF